MEMWDKLKQFTPYRPYKNPIWLLGNCFGDRYLKDIAKEQRVHPVTVTKWLKHWNLWFPNKGNTHTSWKGGRTIRNNVLYIMKKDHPKADRDGYIAEHILIAEEKIGRQLKDTEVVHHINMDSLDNNPENLYIYDHASTHISAHRSIDKFVKKLLDKQIIKFEGGNYSIR